MNYKYEHSHWEGWAESIAETVTISGIVFLQLGSSYLATADVLAGVGFALIDVNAYLDGDSVEGNLVVLSGMDALATSAEAARLGRLRTRVHADVKEGKKFVLQSSAPRLVYTSNNMLVQDATFATGPTPDAWALGPDSRPVFEAELDKNRPFRAVLRAVLSELGTSICAHLDRIVYESGDPNPGTHELDATEVEALKGASLLDSTGRWRLQDLSAVLRRELTDVLDLGRDDAEYLRDIVGEFDALTFSLRRTIRAAARARWGPGWASECLTSELAQKVLQRASNELVLMAESVSDIRDVLVWLRLADLLSLRRSSALGGLGLPEATWKHAERELAPVEDRLRFFGHVTRQDKARVKKWSGVFAEKLSHTEHLGVINTSGAGSSTEASIIAHVKADLEKNPAYKSAAGAAFMPVVLATVRFLRQTADVRVSYTRPFDDGKAPTESVLQEHFYWYLASTGLGDSSFMEVPNQGTGRVDVLVLGEGGTRFVTEVKRELHDASFDGVARSYFGQAAAYQTTGEPFGQLLVLDLTEHSQGVPAVADSVRVENRVVGGSVRSVVVYIVRGNLPAPSATKSPSVLSKPGA